MLFKIFREYLESDGETIYRQNTGVTLGAENAEKALQMAQRNGLGDHDLRCFLGLAAVEVKGK